MSHRHPRRTHAFTLIELLVVIAIIALLIGILIPALGKARQSARTTKCLTQVRAMGQAFSFYANDFKDWYPIMPPGPVRDPNTGQPVVDARQEARGGLAGLYSLEQQGNAPALSQSGSTLTRGWYGGTPDNDQESLDGYLTAAGTPGGSRTPLMRNYLDTLNVLTCPSDREDIYYNQLRTQVPSPQGIYPDATTIGQWRRTPQVITNELEVVQTNISYVYIVGFSAVDAKVVMPVPFFGDETNGNDIATSAFYGAGNGTNANAASQNAESRGPGFYGKVDNHGAAGGNFVYTDGSGKFITTNVQEAIFTGSTAINGSNGANSTTTRTID